MLKFYMNLLQIVMPDGSVTAAFIKLVPLTIKFNYFHERRKMFLFNFNFWYCLGFNF